MLVFFPGAEPSELENIAYFVLIQICEKINLVFLRTLSAPTLSFSGVGIQNRERRRDESIVQYGFTYPPHPGLRKAGGGTTDGSEGGTGSRFFAAAFPWDGRTDLVVVHGTQCNSALSPPSWQ